MYKFLVHIEDFDISAFEKQIPIGKKLTSATSVNKLKFDFFSLLSKIGELVQIDNTFLKTDIETLCQDQNVIYVAVHGNPPEGVACRFLSHNLGGLMVTGGYLGAWEFRNSTINVVTSEIQQLQLKKRLKKACPNLSVITPSISTESFRIPSLNEKTSSKKNKDTFDLIYAGRFIANKGVTQLIRALNIWPIENTQLTLVGDFEPDFFIYHSNAYHTTFPDFFSREILERSPNLKISVNSAVPSDHLKNFYWNSDCFVYPSFHDDENFGLAPREAMLCGIPSVVTDFCGLGQLKGSNGGIIKTYPSLGGVRYSLNELRNEIVKIKKWSIEEREENIYKNASFVKEECCQENALNSLKKALNKLKKTITDSTPYGGWRSKERFESLAEKNKSFFKKAIENKDRLIPKGLYVDGTGSIPEGQWYSDAHFMQAIQSIYTSFPKPPFAQKNMTYRGFWRVSLWEQESAVVEFGFPGPRIIRFTKDEFESLKNCHQNIGSQDVIFSPKKEKEIILIQKLIDLGYVVPDKL